MDAPENRWVFAYGSLIWRPGFAFLRAVPALLRGRHRRLCIYSDHYRGTPERRGLVFGLARGGTCGGMGFEVAAEAWPEVLAYLRERELVGNVYREAWRPVTLADGARLEALTYLAIENHPLYAGRLTLEEEAAIVLAATGRSGANLDYVLNTARHLRELGIADRHLSALVRRLSPPATEAA